MASDERIPCTEETRRELWRLKEGPNDTYDDVIRRLVDRRDDRGD